MAFGGASPSSRITLAQLALLLSSMLVPVQPVPVQKGARFVIHVPYTIEHIHHHHKEKVFIPVVHHKKHPLEDSFKEWHHIVVEESDGHHGKPTHTAHEGFSVAPQKSHFEQLDGGFSVTPEKNQASLDTGYSITPEKTQSGSADSGFEITPEEAQAGLEDSGFNLTPEINQENLADSGYSINSQKTEAAFTDVGLSLTPQKWPTLTGLSHRNPFSGRHFGRSLGAQPPMYNPHFINIPSQNSVGGDAKDEDSGYKTKEEVEDVTTPAPPGFKPQAVANIQRYQQSSGNTESQESLQQIQPNLDYEPNLQLQYQASFQPQANLEHQANVELPVNPIGVSYIPGQVMSYQIMDHQGNAFNRLTLHNKREAKYKLHAPVLDSKSKGQRVRIPMRIQHSGMMTGLMRLPHTGEAYRSQHPGMPHKNLMRVPEGMKSEKVSQGQAPSGYDALTSDSKPVAQISTQDGKVLFKVGGKRGIPEKTPVRQREPGRISGSKVELSMPTKIMQNTMVKVRVPVRVTAAYKETRRIPSDKAVSGIKSHTQISPQTDRLVPKVESKIKSQETAMSANVGVSSGRKKAELTSNGYDSSTSESNTGFDKDSQTGKMAFKVQHPQETAVAVHQGSPESKLVTSFTKEHQTVSKEKDKMADQQREMSASPKESSEELSQVFYPSIGPFGNSESTDVSLGHQQESASSKVADKKAYKKTSVTTQTT